MDVDRVLAEIWDPRNDPQDSRRYYLNQPTSARDAWISHTEWAARCDATIPVPDRTTITLGFDGSRKRHRGVTDATALVGCTLDGHLFEIQVWEQPANVKDWAVPVDEVERAINLAFRTWNVVGFYCDPAKWESYIAGWEAKWGPQLVAKATRDHPCEWWMTGGRSTLTVRALDKFYNAVIDGGLTHDGSDALNRHVLNARRRVSKVGLQIAKEHPDSPKKIDAAVAGVLAWTARLDALAKGVDAPKTAEHAPYRIL
jgi:phage terminase large subunit-like protein